MSLSGIISLIIAFVCILLGFALEGGQLPALLSFTSLLIIFGGTAGAVGMSFPAGDLKRIPKILGVAFKNRQSNVSSLIEYFREVSIKTRKEGLLSIESDITSNDKLHPLIRKGLQMVVDGIEPNTVRNILESQAYAIFERHKSGIAIFEAAGGYAPTMGIIGTVLGLVHVLSNLEEPSSLGAKIAAAFIATLYGISSANLLWLPIANKLKALNKIENRENELIIEAIISIQEGLNPNTLVEKLNSLIDLKETEEIKNSGEKVTV